VRLTATTVEDIDFRSPRGLAKAVVLRLAGCDWIRHHAVLIEIGELDHPGRAGQDLSVLQDPALQQPPDDRRATSSRWVASA
jgi:hypothetical protein